ncbi:helix-turn-helix domain-containing protein [Vineibacter terrae]|uniref:AraC family transcriptional regulator n=1 Tax=Vineibacter terrae TaxID=2586908 RepID=UPI002E34D3D3|nr:helix-turn-helix domain-containing protein [Vineibacter terrae]HEX2885631.1 helix-turn-helix domain-containing protein [Vineibacter terrae]
MSHHVARHSFSDFGQCREQLHGIWDMDATQLSAGRLSLALDCLDVGDVVLSHLRFDRAAAVRSVEAPGWRALIVHVSPKRWCGIDLPAGAFVAIPSGREACVLSHEPWESIGVFVRHETLAAWEAPLADFADADPQCRVLVAEPATVRRYRDWVRMVFEAALSEGAQDGAVMWPDAILDALREHLTEVLSCPRHLQAQPPLVRVARYELAVAAMRMVQQATERRITVRDLSLGLGVTERSLQYAFIRVIGVTPAQYILADRLNRVRRHLLLQGRSGATVTAAAYDHQFENLSRFALQYARLFGERPSDTLQGARAAMHLAGASQPSQVPVQLPKIWRDPLLPGVAAHHVGPHGGSPMADAGGSRA